MLQIQFYLEIVCKINDLKIQNMQKQIQIANADIYFCNERNILMNLCSIGDKMYVFIFKKCFPY